MTAPSRVVEISLSQFRCFESITLTVPTSNVGSLALVGANGTGKTSILEAISLFAPGRGLRSAANERLARRDENGILAPAWRISLKLDGGGNAHHQLSLESTHTARKTCRLDDEKVSSISLAEKLPLLWLTPAQINLFSGAARMRRAFLDRIVAALYPDHARILTRAERLRKERRLLLQRDIQEPSWLDSVEAGLAAETLAAADYRQRATRQIEDSLRDLSPPFCRLHLLLTGDGMDVSADKHANLAALAARLCSSRHIDAASGRSSVGPHRLDFSIQLDTPSAPRLSGSLASTGEEKRAILSLLLSASRALLEAGRCPVLLLDELVAHLDESISDALFSELANLGIQVWASGQEVARFPPSRFLRYGLRLEAGSGHSGSWLKQGQE
ncbi:MAG: AAA family ATPase [Alphaproteobacteria bacterium]